MLVWSGLVPDHHTDHASWTSCKVTSLPLTSARSVYRSRSRGDFGDPAKIHGNEMPGLAELSKGFQRFKVADAELPHGARQR